MSFTIPNLHSADFVNSAKLSINDFTRKHPLASIIGIIALSILTCNVIAAGTFTGLILGTVFVYGALTSANHMLYHREDFIFLIRASFRFLSASNFEERQLIERQAELIRNRIIERNI